MSLGENEEHVLFQKPREENVSSLQIRRTASPPWLGVEVQVEQKTRKRHWGSPPPHHALPLFIFCEPGELNSQGFKSKPPLWPSPLRKEIDISQGKSCTDRNISNSK